MIVKQIASKSAFIARCKTSLTFDKYFVALKWISLFFAPLSWNGFCGNCASIIGKSSLPNNI